MHKKEATKVAKHDINGVKFSYENKDVLVFPEVEEPSEKDYLNSIKETATGLLDDLAGIVELGKGMNKEKINYSFKSIFNEENKQ